MNFVFLGCELGSVTHNILVKIMSSFISPLVCVLIFINGIMDQRPQTFDVSPGKLYQFTLAIAGASVCESQEDMCTLQWLAVTETDWALRYLASGKPSQV